MRNNFYTNISDKKRKKSAIMPDVKGSIDSFNHAVEGTGNMVGTGMAMAEDVEDIQNEILASDDIFTAIENNFPITDFPEKGATFILPNGKFLNPKGYR